MSAGKKKPAEKNPATPGIERTLRDDAEMQLARSPESSPDLKGQTPEALIHELQVHQIELETQAEELRKAHLALEESRDKYLDLYDFAPLGYLTLSDKALITDSNLTGAALLGIERSRLVKVRFSKFVAENDADEWYRYFLNVLKQEEKRTCTLILNRGDGSSFPAQLEGIRITGSDGAFMVRIAFIDITELKRAEKALRETNKKLNLLSSITRHDINNQLVTINGFLELLHRKVPNDPEREDFFEKITNASARIDAMIQFTREYEKIGSNAPVWQDCHILVNNAIKQTPLGDVMVKNDLPAGIEVFADPLMVKVWYNLMDNAVKYGGKISIIRFSAQERDSVQIIVCEDDGDGILAEEKERIFDRGFGKNTGLGLTLSREILAITGITISETGEPGEGARFEITVSKDMWRIGKANRKLDFRDTTEKELHEKPNPALVP